MATATTISQPLTTNQKRGFLAAWAGWALDGMDSFIYALVLVPALTELLPNSGIEVTPGNIGAYGGILFALFLLGWGTSMVWGPIGDRIGRVRTLMLDDPDLFAVYVSLCVRNEHLAACGSALLLWYRDRRRAADWDRLHRRRTGREPPQDGRRIDAHRLLLRILSCGRCQLLHRRQLRLAMDVHPGRHACAADRLHPLRRPRVEEVAREVRP